MLTCPGCRDDHGSPREASVTLTRWTRIGTETTVRCPVCGWETSYREPEAPAPDRSPEPGDPPRPDA